MVYVKLSLDVQPGGEVRSTCNTASPQYLVFDTETNGGTNQVCIELAYIVYDRDFMELYRYKSYWTLPPGHSINAHALHVHGISEATIRYQGVDPRPGLEQFYKWVDRVASHGGVVVAHNAAFDATVIRNTSRLNGLTRTLEKEECFCTMRRAAQYAGCKNKRGQQRCPKNSELYTILYGTFPMWATLHSALDDVRVTAMNLRAGRDRGWWTV
tara:strand:+ start:1238 stop:1876 length:639 start_codon:yes stop_codon:yes gene_type:complete